MESYSPQSVVPEPIEPDRHWFETTIDFLSSTLLMVAIVLALRFFVIQPFRVDGASMEPTLADREYILVDKVSYRLHPPKHGDIVIFNPKPDQPDLSYIKRMIGLPGERVVIANGQVTVYNDQHPGGEQLDERYLAKSRETFVQSDPGRKIDVTLGPNEYFVLGDNREHSYDSRSLGAIQQSQLVGRARFIILPVSAAGELKSS